MSATGEQLDEFLRVMLRLRAECAWKAEQTHRSLSRYLLEETYETLEAIDTGDPSHLQEELGDVLLQVVFHSVIAAERGDFTLADVVAGITEKMIRRNPHVFAEAPGGDAHAVNEAWEVIKENEKQRSGPLDGIPAELPALLYAVKVLDRLGRSGGSAPGGEVSALSPNSEIGEQLLALVEQARLAGVDPEQALRDVVRRRTQNAEPPAHD